VNRTETFAEFLACISEEDDPVISKDIDKFIHAHLGFYSDDKWGIGSVASERKRLAAAFLEKAQDTGLTQLILAKILKLNPVG
jgi:hypothetical protein